MENICNRSKAIAFMQILLFMSLFTAQSQEKETQENIVIGKTRSIYSEILKEHRPLWVHLPEGYEDSLERYPVLYLLDGDWHFHHVSGIVQFFTWAKKQKGMIIVALPNTHRGRDFSPSTWPGYNSYTGGADDFIGFLERELIPFINQTYRAGPQKILVGHSLAGTFTLYCFLTKPEIFQAYISLSPCLFWHDRLMLKKSEEFLDRHRQLKSILFIAHEYTKGSPESTMREFVDAFKARAPEGLHWVSLHKPDDDHFTYVHKAIYDGLEFIVERLVPEMK